MRRSSTAYRETGYDNKGLNKMKKIPIEDIENGKLPRGSLIIVRWLDASNVKASLRLHEKQPEAYCKDWGIYLGISGRKHRLLIVAKSVVEVYREWGATRIPIELVEEVHLLIPHDEVMESIQEVLETGRRVRLRRYNRMEEQIVVRLT